MNISGLNVRESIELVRNLEIYQEICKKKKNHTKTCLVYYVCYNCSDFQIKLKHLGVNKEITSTCICVVNLFALLKAKHAVHIRADAIASLPPLFFKPNSIGEFQRSSFPWNAKLNV